jgi:hypothetical protein
MADLARNDQIQRHTQRFRHLDAEDHAAAWQGINDTRLAPILHEIFGQLPAGFGSVSKSHGSFS